VWGKMACLGGAHHWSEWEIPDPQQPCEQARTCARCRRTQKSGDSIRGKMACLGGAHHWSEWQVPDLEQPWKQARTCARCLRTKDNTLPVPLGSAWAHRLG
jgi:hypothetical protein